MFRFPKWKKKKKKKKKKNEDTQQILQYTKLYFLISFQHRVYDWVSDC